MDLNQLRCFIAVAQENSFIRAAERMNLSGPAISKHIASLEKKLDVVLFHRSTRHVELSDSGTRFYEKIAPSLNNIDEAMAEVTDLQDCPRGKLRISVAMSFGHLCLLDFFIAFAKDYPQVRLELRFEDKFIDLQNEPIDVLIRIGDLAPSNFYAQKLADCPLWLCASPQLFEHYNRPKNIKDISQLPAICYQHHRLKDEWHIQGNNSKDSIPFNTIMTCNSAESMLTAVINGLGIAELPAFSAIEAIKQKKIEILFPNYSAYPARGIYAIYKEKLKQSTRLSTFIQALIDYSKRWKW